MTTWAFVDGVKVVDGRRVPLARSKTYLSSNGSTIYTRCWWADGTQSCNCPGWSQRVDKATGDRSCGHTLGKKERFAIDDDRRGVGPTPTFKVAPQLTTVEVRGRIVGKEE